MRLRSVQTGDGSQPVAATVGSTFMTQRYVLVLHTLSPYNLLKCAIGEGEGLVVDF